MFYKLPGIKINHWLEKTLCCYKVPPCIYLCISLWIDWLIITHPSMNTQFPHSVTTFSRKLSTCLQPRTWHIASQFMVSTWMLMPTVCCTVSRWSFNRAGMVPALRDLTFYWGNKKRTMQKKNKQQQHKTAVASTERQVKTRTWYLIED